MIRLPVPPSTNALYRGRRYKTNEYKNWRLVAGLSVAQSGVQKFEGPVVISIKAPENNRRDISNYIKAVEDLLVLHEIIEDDRCKIVRGISAVWHDGENVEVTIEAVACASGTTLRGTVS